MVSAEHSQVTVSVKFTPESREHYTAFTNAVAAEIIDYAEHTGQRYPLYDDRYRAADTAWRELYPDSEFGHEFGQWPGQPAAPELVPEPRTPGVGGLVRAAITAAWRWRA